MTDEYEIDTDPDRPLDDCERWLEEEYFPHILPSFPPFEYVDRAERVTFEDTFGVRCGIGADEIATAFLALVDNGLLPPVTDKWRDRIADDLKPEKMLARPGPVALVLPPEREQADPAKYPAQFIGLAIHEDTLGCPCCGTRAHAILRTPVSEHRITERNVVAAMHLLALANAMPPLSTYWRCQMNERYDLSPNARYEATETTTDLTNSGLPGGSDTPVMTPNGKSVCQIVTEKGCRAERNGEGP